MFYTDWMDWTEEFVVDAVIIADVAEIFGYLLRTCVHSIIKDMYTISLHNRFVADKFEDMIMNIDNLECTHALFSLMKNTASMKIQH